MNFKKLILTLLTVTFITNVFSQSGPPSFTCPYSSMVQSVSAGTSTWNSIGTIPIYPIIIGKGTESWTNNVHSLIFPNYTAPRNDGFPDRIVFIDGSSGAMKVSGVNALDTRFVKISDSSFYTTRNYLSNQFYSKTQSDVRYLQSYTETDPIWNSVKSLYRTKLQNDSLYQIKGSYLTSEVDPVFTIHPAFNITGTNISNWNTAFGWGNHATAGYFLTSNFNSTFDTRFATKTTTNLSEGTNLYFTNSRALSATASAYKPIGYTPTSLEITTALGFTPYNGGTNPNNYITTAGARTAISLTTTGTSGAATYNSSTGVLNIPVYTTSSSPTINNNVSRSLSDATGSTNRYTISTTLNARVTYTISISWSITALLATSTTVYLEYSTNGGSTWNIVHSPGKSLALGLILSGTDDISVSGEIPANALVRLRPSTTNATLNYIRGQEVLY